MAVFIDSTFYITGMYESTVNLWVVSSPVCICVADSGFRVGAEADFLSLLSSLLLLLYPSIGQLLLSIASCTGS